MRVASLIAKMAHAIAVAKSVGDLAKNGTLTCKKGAGRWFDRCVDAENNRLDSICSPKTTNGGLDISAPCVQNEIIFDQCFAGLPFSEVWNATSGTFNDLSKASEQSIANQRLCACESHYFDTLAGCNDCWEAHGASEPLWIPKDLISSVSSSYCAATATPSKDLFALIFDFGFGPAVSTVITAAMAEITTSTFSDPLSSKAAVSLYYTPEVTGSAVFNIAGVTHGAKPPSTHVVDGQITNGAKSLADELKTMKMMVAALMGVVALLSML